MERGDTYNERGMRGRGRVKEQGNALVWYGCDNDHAILSQDIVAASPAEPQHHIGAQDLYHEWHAG